MRPKDADGIANIVDPDQTAPLWAVWSGCALFAPIYVRKRMIITLQHVSNAKNFFAFQS